MRTRKFIMVHHSATADGQTVSWGAIERYHKEVQGWRDCGYHAGVELTGDPAKLGERYAWQALVGRPLEEEAAACPQGGMNNLALHVCCVGDYDRSAPPLPLLERLVKRVILPWMDTFDIMSADRIVGHRDYNPHKTCPGKLFDLEVVRRMVRQWA